MQQELDLPVVTDVHSPEEAQLPGEVCDILQIPALAILVVLKSVPQIHLRHALTYLPFNWQREDSSNFVLHLLKWRRVFLLHY